MCCCCCCYCLCICLSFSFFLFFLFFFPLFLFFSFFLFLFNNCLKINRKCVFPPPFILLIVAPLFCNKYTKTVLHDILRLQIVKNLMTDVQYRYRECVCADELSPIPHSSCNIICHSAIRSHVVLCCLIHTTWRASTSVLYPRSVHCNIWFSILHPYLR